MEIEDIKRLRIRSGDKLVVRMPERLTPERVSMLRDYLERFIGDPSVKILILDKGMTLDILTKEEA